MKLTGAEILIECLIEQNVDTVFGYPGGAVLNIYDAFYKYRDKITHYLTSHEQGASHAADGYARATGKTGVCVATSGPGATNLVTGIATAYMDSTPMVAITGNVAKSLLGKDSFQEVDTAGITMPITKHNFIVKDIEYLADTVRRAFYIAREGRPGPVLIDITKDVTGALYEYERQEPREITRKTNTITDADIDAAIELIKEAKRPLIYAGGGVILSDAAQELRAFAGKIDAPVALTLMGLGAFPASHPNFTGMVGMHGTKTSNTAVMECDLLIAAGARFSDRVISDVSKFAKNAKILHLDVDAAEINKNIFAQSQVIGDIREVLRILNEKLTQLSHSSWIAHIRHLKQEFPLKQVSANSLHPQYILERINEISEGKALISTDVGQHQIWAGQYIKCDSPRSFITSGGLGTMGFGLGAAIGASIGRGKELVFNITGDGSFRMNCIELATAVEYNIPVIDVIMNNHVLGMVRQWQTFFYDGRYSQTVLNNSTDFVRLAEAYGAAGLYLSDPAKTDETIKKAIELAAGLRCPVVINCEISSDEKVFPMVPPGESIDNVILE
ncbi:acetolactate synthase [Clostridia bacterium]|nr:acetolactate synthase [Clostridia bacterium]